MKINLWPFPFSALPRNFSNFPTSQRQTSKFCLYLWLPLLSWRINLEVTGTSGLEGCANIYRGRNSNRRDQMKRGSLCNCCFYFIHPSVFSFPFFHPHTVAIRCLPTFFPLLTTFSLTWANFHHRPSPFYFHHGSFLASTISFLFLVLQFSQI